MNCIFCDNKPLDYRAFTCAPRMEISMPLCEKCLSDNSSLFTFWHSLSPVISIPGHVWTAWQKERWLDSSATSCIPVGEYLPMMENNLN